MKRLIRWLACVAGIERQIRRDQQAQDAQMIREASYYFSQMPEVFNAMSYSADYLQKYGIIRADEVREMVQMHGNKRWMDHD